ncbi:hypothetical protein ACJX0J_007353, partial [Zea mays]
MKGLVQMTQQCFHHLASKHVEDTYFFFLFHLHTLICCMEDIGPREGALDHWHQITQSYDVKKYYFRYMHGHDSITLILIASFLQQAPIGHNITTNIFMNINFATQTEIETGTTNA